MNDFQSPMKEVETKNQIEVQHKNKNWYIDTKFLNDTLIVLSFFFFFFFFFFLRKAFTTGIHNGI